MKPAGKTPYEIRLDLLQLAFDILIAKAGSDLNNTGGGHYVPRNPPTTEEIIAEAEKMNAFISKANQ